MMKTRNVCYLCSGKDSECKKSICKFLKRGDCYHTTKESCRLKTDKETLWVLINDDIECEIFSDELEDYKNRFRVSTIINSDDEIDDDIVEEYLQIFKSG